MRYILVVLMLLITTPSLATNWCEDANIGGCWLLDVDSSSQTDASGNGNTGSVSGATFTSSGQFDGGYVFDGSDDYINLGSDSSIATLTFTYVAWIKTHATTNADANRSIFGSSTSSDGYQFIVNSTEKLEFVDQNQVVIATSTGTITNDTWTHIALTYNHTSNAWVFYINGVDAGNGTQDATVAIASIWTGARYHISGVIEEFAGTEDELAIFNDIKDSTDITDMMNNGLVQAEAHRVPTSLELRNVTIY